MRSLKSLYLCSLSFLLLPGLSILAQTPADSTPVFDVDTVRVIDHRSLLSDYDIAGSTSRLSVSRAERSDNMADLLSRQSGVFVKSYGAGEGLQSISVRGGGSEHALFLLDGIPLTNMQLGSVDMGHYQLQTFSEVELYRGGNSTLFGSGAISGAINAIVRPVSRFDYGSRIKSGAFGARQFSAFLDLPSGRFTHALRMSSANSDNAYAFQIDGDEFERRNSDYRQQEADYLLSFGISEGQMALLQTHYSKYGNGTPNAILTGDGFQGNARSKSEQLLLRLKWQQDNGEGHRRVMQAYLRRDWRHYENPDLAAGTDVLRSQHFNEEGGVIGQYSALLTSQLRVYGGFEGATGRVNSSELRDTQRRQRMAVYSLSEWQPASSQKLTPLMSAALRYEYDTDFGDRLLPRAGMKLRYRNWELFSSLGSNFRVPTFNDLYWAPGGNPNLQPETSTAVEIGSTLDWRRFGIWQLESAWYFMNIRDMIRWAPTSNGFWQPQNLDRVQSSGIETSLSASSSGGRLQLHANYKHGISRRVNNQNQSDPLHRNRLPYLPAEEFFVQVTGAQKQWQLSLEYQHASFRYTSIANLPGAILPAYQIVNLKASYEVAIGSHNARFFGRFDNLLQEEYQLILNYPLPVYQWRIGFEITRH